MTAEQTQLELFDDPPPNIDGLLTKREDQWFDRKSFRIKDYDLAAALVGFANADGGRIAVGLYNGEIEGVDSDVGHVNSLMQAAFDFTEPPVRHGVHFIDCVNRKGLRDRVMLLEIEASEVTHRTKRGECFLRVGDETRRLGLTEERELLFDKGESIFDKTVVPDLTRDELDTDAIQAYAEKVGAKDVSSLTRSRGIYLDGPYHAGVTQAGWLLFGRTPPIWCYVRYMRYEGATIETGTRSNLIEDVRLEGPIPALIEQAKDIVSDRNMVIRLTPSGRFGRVPALPEFAWLEAIVNAVTHRAYSLQGDGIRIRQFSDRLEIESPGRLPGLVRVQNIQKTRFSRNPHIARVLAEMTEYVRESNEGIRRMFEEMEGSGLRAPLYEMPGASVRVTLYKQLDGDVSEAQSDQFAVWLSLLGPGLKLERAEQLLDALRESKRSSTSEVARQMGISRFTARRYLEGLQRVGLVVRKGKSTNDPTAVWSVSQGVFRKNDDV